MKRISYTALLMAILTSLFMAVSGPTTASAASFQQNPRWCGNGDEADNFGFTYNLTQPHWTIANGLVSEQTMTDVDVILDKLNADQLAQTMILVLPENQVGNPVNCAVHFLRYMNLGLLEGPHADNGFVWLFILKADSVEVRYGAGMGLPALTAPALGDLKRVGVDTYASTKSVDSAVLAVVTAYDTYVRSEYQIGQPANNPGAPLEQGGAPAFTLLQCFCCIGIGVLFLFFFFAYALAGGGSSSTGGTYVPSGNSTRRSTSSPSPSRPSNPGRSGSGSGRSARGG